jgi:hypothetical protein
MHAAHARSARTARTLGRPRGTACARSPAAGRMPGPGLSGTLRGRACSSLRQPSRPARSVSRRAPLNALHAPTPLPGLAAAAQSPAARHSHAGALVSSTCAPAGYRTAAGSATLDLPSRPRTHCAMRSEHSRQGDQLLQAAGRPQAGCGGAHPRGARARTCRSPSTRGAAPSPCCTPPATSRKRDRMHAQCASRGSGGAPPAGATCARRTVRCARYLQRVRVLCGDISAPCMGWPYSRCHEAVCQGWAALPHPTLPCARRALLATLVACNKAGAAQCAPPGSRAWLHWPDSTSKQKRSPRLPRPSLPPKSHRRRTSSAVHRLAPRRAHGGAVLRPAKPVRVRSFPSGLRVYAMTS